MPSLRTCKHIYDDGNTCSSVAAKDRDYCAYHLRHRARLMRMAQARASQQRFDLRLPPLESMYAVQSALTQVLEALAADMLDLKRADRILRVLSVASRNLLKADKWPTSPYHSDQAAAIDVASEFGLPQDLDLDTPPEVAFPPAVEPSAPPTDNSQPATGNSDADLDFRPDFPISPQSVEVCEIYETQGPDAAQVRCDQLERNRARRDLRLDRKRYADIALRQNIQIAAEKLAARKLQAAAHEASSASQKVAKKPPASAADPANFPKEAELTPTGSHG